MSIGAQAIVDALDATGVIYRESGPRVRHSGNTRSCHYYRNTGCEAVDVDSGIAGIDPQGPMFDIWHAIEPWFGDLHEAIYTPAGYSIRDGRQVPPIAAADHHDHIHLSILADRTLTLGAVMPADDPSIPNTAHPIVAALDDPGTGGYRLVAADGGVFCFGGASYHGSVPELAAAGTAGPVDPDGPNRIVGAVAHNGDGYWLFGADGGVFAFGSARYKGRVEVV